MLMAGQTLETVRRQLQNEGAEFKGSLWSPAGNAWNLSAEGQQQRRALCLQYTKLGRAMTLRDVRQHWKGILAYFDTGLTWAAIEAVNGIIQLAKRMARGFKNFVYFRTASYLRAGRLKFELPVSAPRLGELR
jgi:transposase